MKIACIAYLHGYGGAERQIINLANQMSNRNHEVHLIMIADNKIRYEIEDRVQIHSLVNHDIESGNIFSKLFKRRKHLIKLLQELNCDINVNFNFQSAYLLAFSNQRNIGKILYSERGDPGDKEYKGIMGMVRKFSMPLIDSFVFQSEGARNYFKKRHVFDNSIVIPNACFLPKSKPYEGIRENCIVNVGRLSEQKNQRLLIEAFSLISPKYPDLILKLYGDGVLLGDLKQKASNLGVSSKVHFMGTCKDICNKIRSAKMFVLSSDYEGIPNALIEAMSVGLPCVSTDCRPGGARSLIRQNENGIIVPVGDAEGLASAIDNVLTNPILAAKLSSNAISITDELSPKQIYDKWEMFIYEVVRKQR